MLDTDIRYMNEHTKKTHAPKSAVKLSLLWSKAMGRLKARLGKGASHHRALGMALL